jgi:hypothetical protein
LRTRTFTSITILAAFLAAAALAAPKAELWEVWERHQPDSTAAVDHGSWQDFLSKYVSAAPDGVNRVDYQGVTPADRASLERYLAQLQATAVTKLNRREQLAYWINLYNALTVRVVLDHLPVDSITDIDISPGFFANGPWGAKLAKVEGHEISLNDVEHRILRPIWQDNRIHYAVNCASIGCPNLIREVFTRENVEDLLDRAAKEYVNHPRGARIEDGRLQVSSLYEWYKVDFGDSDQGVIDHLRRYATGELAKRLEGYSGGLSDGYDWSLNAPVR